MCTFTKPKRIVNIQQFLLPRGPEMSLINVTPGRLEQIWSVCPSYKDVYYQTIFFRFFVGGELFLTKSRLLPDEKSSHFTNDELFFAKSRSDRPHSDLSKKFAYSPHEHANADEFTFTTSFVQFRHFVFSPNFLKFQNNDEMTK